MFHPAAWDYIQHLVGLLWDYMHVLTINHFGKISHEYDTTSMPIIIKKNGWSVKEVLHDGD